MGLSVVDFRGSFCAAAVLDSLVCGANVSGADVPTSGRTVRSAWRLLTCITVARALAEGQIEIEMDFTHLSICERFA